MPQDQTTGAAANVFGRENAQKLAAALGAKLTKPGSNQAQWDGKLVVLKSAALDTNSVGVTYLTLERIDEVVAALERVDGAFDIYSLSASIFRSAMSPTRSKGPSSGRVGVVRRSVFESQGHHLGIKNLR